MVLSFRFALICSAITQTAASWASPDLLPDPMHNALMLRVSNRRIATRPERQESAVTGSSFRIHGGLEHGGEAELLTIPKGATGKDVLMKVVVQAEHHGPREEDMWIRRAQVSGQWLKQKWAFKTGSGFYGSPENYLARLGHGDWKAPVDLLKASDGLMSLAIHNKEVPTRMFQSSTAQDISLVVGPVTVDVMYKTSNKDGVNFNHLDVYLTGLSSVVQELGGLLISDPPAPPPPSNTTDELGDEEIEGPEDPEDPEDPESLDYLQDPGGLLEDLEDLEDPEAEKADILTPPAELLQAVRSDVYLDSL